MPNQYLLELGSLSGKVSRTQGPVPTKIVKR